MIYFKKIKIQGFGSIIEPLEYALDNPGLTVISGKVGSGKSTIFGALSWALFGKVLKKGSEFKPWADILPDNFEGTKVEVKFKVNGIWYKVIRCNDFKGILEGYKGKNRLILFEGAEESKIKGIIPIQKRIIEILGYSFHLFKHTLLFGQDLVRLINLDNSDKKLIFEEAFEVVYIAKAKAKGEDKREQIQKLINKIEPEITQIKSKLEILKVKIQNEKLNHQTFNETKEANLKDLRERYTLILNNITKLRKNKAQLKKRKSNLFGVKVKVKELEPFIELKRKEEDSLLNNELSFENHQHQREKLKDEFTLLNTNNPICPTCKKPLKDKSIIKNKRAELKLLLSQNLKVVTNLKDLIKGNKELISSIEIKLALLKEFKAKLKELDIIKYDLKSNLTTYLEQKKSLDELSAKITIEEAKAYSKDNLICLINERKVLRQDSKPKRLELLSLKKELSLYEWAIKDPLSNSGIKAYIFSTMLDLTNHELIKYAKALGFIIRFDVDMESVKKGINTTIYKDNKPRAYEDFSGGQKNLVNLSTAFAINDTTTRNKGCNILLMDEIFEYLDRESIEKVTELIKIKAQDKCIHLVTHDERFDSSTARVIQLELDDNGCTVRTA